MLLKMPSRFRRDAVVPGFQGIQSDPVVVSIPGRAHPGQTVGDGGDGRQYREVRESLDVFDRLERRIHLFYEQDGGYPEPQTCQETHEDDPLTLRAVWSRRQ